MKPDLSRRFAFILIFLALPGRLPAVDTNSPILPKAPAEGLPLAELLGLAQGLEINPKVITATDGKGTTIGISYKYERELKRAVFHRDTDLAFSLHSSGLFVADESKVPNHVFTHGLRLSLIDLWPAEPAEDSAAWKLHAQLKERISSLYMDPWTKLAESDSPD